MLLLLCENIYSMILSWAVCASVGSANNNKLSLVWLQLPEQYKEKFDVSNQGRPFVGVTTVAGVGKITWAFKLKM
jgi:hypothetical protein